MLSKEFFEKRMKINRISFSIPVNSDDCASDTFADVILPSTSISGADIVIFAGVSNTDDTWAGIASTCRRFTGSLRPAIGVFKFNSKYVKKQKLIDIGHQEF